LVGLIGLVVAVGIAFIAMRRFKPNPPVPVAFTPTTAPATASTLRPATVAAPPPPPTDLLSLVRANDTAYPTTQELELAVNYEQGAHIVLNQPVYLDPAGHLWITDPRGASAESLMADLGKDNSHIVTDRIVFAHWSLDNAGNWITNLVRRTRNGEYELVGPSKVTPLPKRNWLWQKAMMWDDKIVVPTKDGVCVFSVNDPSSEQYQVLIPTGRGVGQYDEPCILFDTRGVIAWTPWDQGHLGSNGAIRFVDGKWSKLDSSTDWPDKILHLVPLLDGSIMQIIPAEGGGISLAMSGVAKEQTNVDEAQIQQLVTRLSDPDPANRNAAYEQLTRYGPGIFPILQKLQDDQPPAAQSRIAELLKSKMNLTLGPITPEPGPVKTITRLRDGGVVFYFDGGVSVASGSGDQPTLISPAWLSIRPGFPVQVLPGRLTKDLQPGKQRLWAFKGEWIVGDDVEGLKWFVGNYLSPLQRKDELKFSEFVGIDSHGRWLMRTPGETPSTLIVDPNLPDVTPRLPVWVYANHAGSAGWTNTNWPAVRPNANAIAVLDAGAWRQPTKDEKFLQRESEMPATTTSATSSPTTSPASSPTTTQESADLILIDKDATRYYDGSNTIRIRTPDGNESTWPLPASAAGTGDVWLFHCGEDRFFLFNQPGRVIRLRRTPDADEPFKIEATFTRNIPNTNPERIWLDPAGRLIIAYNGNVLAILSPSGRIPPEIRQMMPPEKADE
jgi:hypothetical protein